MSGAPPGQTPDYTGPPYGGGPFDSPTGSPPGGRGNKGTIIAALVALVVIVIGAIGFVVLRCDSSDVESDSTAAAPDRSDPAPTGPTESSDPTDPPTTGPEAPTADQTPTASGSVDGVDVRIDARGEVVPDADLDATLRGIAEAQGGQAVSSTGPVLNLCAALTIDEPVDARVTWSRDGTTILENPTRTLATPADGNCINNNGEPLEDGSYEARFTDVDGGESLIALFTVGAATRSEVFANDTGTDVCFIDLSPSTAGFYQSFEPTGGPLLVGESIMIDIADVDHDLRAADCDDNELEAVSFTPSDDPVSLASGSSTTPSTEPPPSEPSVPQVTDDDLSILDGVIASFEDVIEPGSPAESAVFGALAAPAGPLPIAATAPSATLCAVWVSDGPLEVDAVWEFNGDDFTTVPVVAVDGVLGSCIPPKGVARFGEGAYQVYLERGDATSQVQTYTVGREQTQLGFVNDSGAEICSVGFSPTLTGFYTFYSFAASDEFDDALQPGEMFTIVAPFIENDIQARDCDDNIVAEHFGIPPTDQTLSLVTGRP